MSMMHADPPPISPKGLERSCVLWILLVPGLGQEGLQMEAFVEGSLLSLVVSSLSGYVINESFTAFSPSPFMDFVTKGYQRAWRL